MNIFVSYFQKYLFGLHSLNYIKINYRIYNKFVDKEVLHLLEYLYKLRTYTEKQQVQY